MACERRYTAVAALGTAADVVLALSALLLLLLLLPSPVLLGRSAERTLWSSEVDSGELVDDDAVELDMIVIAALIAVGLSERAAYSCHPSAPSCRRSPTLLDRHDLSGRSARSLVRLRSPTINIKHQGQSYQLGASP